MTPMRSDRVTAAAWLRRLLAAFAFACAGAGMLALSVSPAAAQTDDDEDALLMQEARAAFRASDYGKAGNLLDRVLAINPRRIDAYVLRAAVYNVRKQYDQAIAILRQAQSLVPDNPDVLTPLGSNLIRAGRAGEGVPILERVVAGFPDRYLAHLNLGGYYVDQGQWQQGIKSLEAYFRTRPSSLKRDDMAPRLELANAYLRSGDPKSARKLYEQVVAEKPGSVLGQMGLAWSVAAIDCNQALPLLSNLADLANTYPEILLVQGRCALLLGKFDEAVRIAGAYQERRPDSAAAWALLGDARIAKRDYKGAREALDEAAARDKGNKLYAFKLARVERLSGQPDKAIERLRSAGPPPDAETEWTIELGESLYAVGNFAEIRQVFAPFVTNNPQDARAQTLLGIAIFELGEPEASVPHLEEAVKLSDRDERAKATLTKALNIVAVNAFKSGNAEAAESALTRADQVRPSPTTWRNLGIIRLQTGKVKEAIKPLQQAVEANSQDDVAYHLLARAFAAAGEYREASKAFERAQKLSRKKDDRSAAIAIDHAASEMMASNAEEAIEILEDALKNAPQSTLRGALITSYVTAVRAASTALMRASNFSKAYRFLNEANDRLGSTLKGEPLDHLQCDLALATTGIGARVPAVRLLRELEKRNARCQFAAPADELAVQILLAWNEGATERTVERALTRLGNLRKKATGSAAGLVRTAARDIAMRAALEAYQKGESTKAKQFLLIADRYDPENPEIDHNLVVIDMAGGKPERHLRRLEELSRTVPEALANLGVAYDTKGEPQKALSYYRRALEAGVRIPALQRWIAAKERLWGSASVSTGGQP